MQFHSQCRPIHYIHYFTSTLRIDSFVPRSPEVNASPLQHSVMVLVAPKNFRIFAFFKSLLSPLQCFWAPHTPQQLKGPQGLSKVPKIAYRGTGTPVIGQKLRIERKSGMRAGLQSTHCDDYRPTKFCVISCKQAQKLHF